MTLYNDLMRQPEFSEAHHRMQDLLIDLKRQYGLEELFDEVIYSQDVALSPAAQLLLVAPLVEVKAMQQYWEQNDITNTPVAAGDDEIRNTLVRLVHEVVAAPAEGDIFRGELELDTGERRWRMRSALSMIKAFAIDFCNIPPLCGETRRGR